MSTEFTTVLCAPDRPLGEILSAIEQRLVEFSGLRHAGKILRCAWQPDSQTFDEATPEQALGPAEHLSAHSGGMARWSGFATEFWNEKMLLYVLVARVVRPEGAFVDAWVTLPTSQLERLAGQGGLRVFYAALAEIAGAMAATAGYGHFELAFEPLPPKSAEQAIGSLPDYPGEPATLGILPAARASLPELTQRYGKTFDIIGTTAGYWVLENRNFSTWLGGQR